MPPITPRIIAYRNTADRSGYDSPPMNLPHLHRELEQADTRAGWVDVLGRYFAAHALYYGHGTGTAEDEAFWLVWQLSGTPDDLAATPPDVSLIPRLVDLANRRVRERVPLAYLLGVAWFSGLEFAVTPDVLVPRSPLAETLERGFAPWCALCDGDRVLEIGTGSGCIAIAAAVHNPQVTIDATEIDSKALELARANVLRHQVAGRVRIVAADLFPADDRRYRVIISNPPYVPTGDIGTLPREYGHEPVPAFDGGPDGLDVVRRIIEGARQRLTGDGLLIVEVGLSADRLAEAYPNVPWTWLEFERGGDGVFVLTADELTNGWG
jgi:ribosomal protein L3 glutamine methyltransferase